VFVLAHDGQTRVDPVGFSFGIIPDIRISHCRQSPGGIVGSMSGGTRAIDNNLGVAIR
jgi:hypothetical protein